MKIETNPKAATKAAAELAIILPALKPHHAIGVLNYLVPNYKIITGTSQDKGTVVLYRSETLAALKDIAQNIVENCKTMTPTEQVHQFMIRIADGRFKFKCDVITACFSLVSLAVKEAEGLYQYNEIIRLIPKLIEDLPENQDFFAVEYANQIYFNKLLRDKLFERLKDLIRIKKEQIKLIQNAKSEKTVQKPLENSQTDMFPNDLNYHTVKALLVCYSKITGKTATGWNEEIVKRIIKAIPHNYRDNVSSLTRSFSEIVTEAVAYSRKNACGMEKSLKAVFNEKFNTDYEIVYGYNGSYQAQRRKIVISIRQNTIELQKEEAKSIVEQLLNSNVDSVVIRGVRISLNANERKDIVSEIMKAL